ncbi:hypothetical protein QPX39_07830 [Corynebacterium propinquum]|uniref:hypothetical protein n=1 Tax=Corynebacterium propinquum TaxID=43769 RepID=UPI002542A199|nr:hypothetical protein [Corynebacterium propinquum]MDK4292682.1 hypothetical protein [Corynebacterium propinquum]
MTENSAINKNVSKKRPEGLSAEEARMYDDFQIGGHEREMPESERLEQLASFIDAHYEKPAGWESEAAQVEAGQPSKQRAYERAAIENYLARLPDRITHAAMIMLGSAVDHSLPVTAYAQGIDTRDDEFGRWYLPENPRGVAVAVVGGWWYAGAAREMSWEPEIAALAGYSQRAVLSVHFPLQPEATAKHASAFVRRALESVRTTEFTTTDTDQLAAWGKWAGADLLLQHADLVDGLALTFPSENTINTTDISAAGGVGTRVMLQELTAHRHVATPTTARAAIREISDFWGRH